MDKFEKLDQLIYEVIGLEERKKSKKGGVKGVKGQGQGGHLELQMAEILKILQVGSETEKTIKSSSAAFQTLLSRLNRPDFSSSGTIIEFFKQFDLTSQSIADERCSSIGALMAKYTIAAGLVSVFEQFNGSAGGFVNENYFSQLLGGYTVPVGGGGIEDIVVGDRIGINLKVKTSKEVHGSFTQLLETLGIPYYAEWNPPAEEGGRGFYSIPSVGDYSAIRHSPFAIITDKKGTPAVNPKASSNFSAFVKSDPKKVMKKLYYLFFEKKESGDSRQLVVHCALLDIEKIKASAKTVVGPDGVKYLNLSQMTNPIYSSIKKLGELGVKNPQLNYISYKFETNFDIASMNEALSQSGQEVLDSVRRLDQWYGDLQEVIMTYVSSLEKNQFDLMLDKLEEGSAWQFKAFANLNCDKKKE